MWDKQGAASCDLNSKINSALLTLARFPVQISAVMSAGIGPCLSVHVHTAAGDWWKQHPEPPFNFQSYFCHRSYRSNCVFSDLLGLDSLVQWKCCFRSWCRNTGWAIIPSPWTAKPRACVRGLLYELFNANDWLLGDLRWWGWQWWCKSRWIIMPEFSLRRPTSLMWCQSPSRQTGSSEETWSSPHVFGPQFRHHCSRFSLTTSRRLSKWYSALWFSPCPCALEQFHAWSFQPGQAVVSDTPCQMVFVDLLDEVHTPRLIDVLRNKMHK